MIKTVLNTGFALGVMWAAWCIANPRWALSLFLLWRLDGRKRR